MMEGGLYDCDSGMLLEKCQPCRQEPCLRFYRYIINSDTGSLGMSFVSLPRSWLLPPRVDMFSVDRTWKSGHNFLLSTAPIRSYFLSIPTTPFPRCTWFTWCNIPLLYPRLVPLCLVLHLYTLLNLLAPPSKGNRCPRAWYDLRSDPRSHGSSTSRFTSFSCRMMLTTPVSA